MATVIFIKEKNQSLAAMRGLIEYCLLPEKVTDRLSGKKMVGGINCYGENALLEFITTKEAYHKTDQVNFYQYVQSFSPQEDITAQKAHEVALEFAAKAWPGYEVLVATHSDAKHLHSHFVINSVSFENGYKLRQDKGSLKKLRAVSDEICRAYGLSTLAPYEYSGSKLSAREYRAAAKGESWKFRLMADIDNAMKYCGSKEEFIQAMQRLGYTIRWEEARANITYTCTDGMKCRDKLLHDQKYLKGSMENEFRIRKELAAKFSSGYAAAEERKSTLRAGDYPLSATGLCHTDSPKGAGAEAVEGGGTIPAAALSADITAGNTGGNGIIHSEAGGGGAEISRILAHKNSGGESADERGNADDAQTGWESARGIYLGLLRQAFPEYREAGIRHQQHEEENYENHAWHGPVIGDALSHSLRALAQADRIADDSTDDEERRREIEARISAGNFGALAGMTMGAIDAIAEIRAEIRAEQEERILQTKALQDEEWQDEELQMNDDWSMQM